MNETEGSTKEISANLSLIIGERIEVQSPEHDDVIYLNELAPELRQKLDQSITPISDGIDLRDDGTAYISEFDLSKPLEEGPKDQVSHPEVTTE